MRTAFLACLMISSLIHSTLAAAAEIKVLTAGAYKPIVMAMVPGFEKATGNQVSVENDTAGALSKRIAGGEAFDLVILTPDAIAQLRRAGEVAPGAPVELARVGIGVVVKNGAPLPNISSTEAFKRTLLMARKVAYLDPAAGGSSGIYLTHVFQRLGIAEQIRHKAVLVPGGHVADYVVDGKADIGIHQISEILAVPGAKLVGPLPPAIQNYTIYAGSLSADSKAPAAARAFLAVLHDDDARAVLKEKGMEAP